MFISYCNLHSCNFSDRLNGDKEQMVGKGPHDPTIGYPEHDHHKKVGDLASSVRDE